MSPEPLTNTSAALRRAWHVVATSDEVGDAPMGVRLFNEPWVLVRLNGAVRAFVDRCPHRLAPLSAGCVTAAGELQCGYHGWRYDARGTCVAIPALTGTDRRTTKANVASAFAVEERYGLVWMAVEKPLAPLPTFEWSDDPTFDTALTTSVRTAVSAGQLVDNFCDAAHFPFVHSATFGSDEAAKVEDRGVEREGWTVVSTFDSWYRVADADDPLVATGEHPAVQPQVLTKRGYAGTVVVLTIEFPITGATLAILFACTPETATRTRVHKLISRNDFRDSSGVLDADRMTACIAEEDLILAEDLAILERYDEMVIHLDPQVELHTRADRLSLAWRRMMAEFVAS